MHERTYLRCGVNVHAGDVVLDVGANVGVAAVFFATECGAGLVYSFEPIPPLYDLLCENVAPYPACVPHNFGLADVARHAVMAYYPDAAAMSSLYANPIEDAALVRTSVLNMGMSEDEADRAVDGRYDYIEVECELQTISDVWREFELDQIDLLKIDVEKAELDVLRGIEDAHWPNIKQVVTEVHDERDRVADVSALFTRWGFVVDVLQDDAMRGTNVRMVFARRR
jgi:FkbM family methyltransferase